MATKMPRATEHVNPNLIPMIDIMFLLLLFFMLGADMGHRELEDVRLPKSTEAVEEPKVQDPRLTINAHHDEKTACPGYDSIRTCRTEKHWRLAFRGEDVTDPTALGRALEQAPSPDGKPLTERKVMIRADGSAPYGLAQQAMLACAKLGITRISVGAAGPAAR